jgi:DNA repair protein RadC
MRNDLQGHKKPSTKVPANQQTTKRPVGASEFKIVRLRDCPVDIPVIDTPPEIVAYWRKHVPGAAWFNADKECLCVFLLNSRHKLIGFELVSQGTLDTILMHPREVLRPAAIHNAQAIIVAHNHPSGDPSPSEGDILATRNLIQAAEQLKIEFLDHVIIGDARLEKSYSSLRELGYFADDDSAPGSPASGSVSGDALDALAIVKSYAKSGISLAVMNNSYMKSCAKNFDGWQDLHLDRFHDGNYELVLVLADQIETDLDAWRDAITGKAKNPASINPKINTENTINAINHVLEMQGTEIGNRLANGAYSGSMLIRDHLQAAFEAACKVCGKLQSSMPVLKAGLASGGAL